MSAADVKTGGPAFPTLLAVGDMALSEGGLTLRDYFAARCPESEVGNPPTWGDIKRFKGLPPNASIESCRDEWTTEYRASKRYAYADAMLAAREKGGAS